MSEDKSIAFSLNALVTQKINPLLFLLMHLSLTLIW